MKRIGWVIAAGACVIPGTDFTIPRRYVVGGTARRPQWHADRERAVVYTWYSDAKVALRRIRAAVSTIRGAMITIEPLWYSGAYEPPPGGDRVYTLEGVEIS